MSIRVLLTILFLGAGIPIMYWLQPIFGGLTAVLIGSLLFIFSLSIWTLPASTFERGHRMDPAQRRLAGAFLGIGLGMFGGLAVAALVPRPFNWIVLDITTVAVTVWYYRK